MTRRWNPSLHPRLPNGQFAPKFSQSVRLSPVSVSYNAGVRVPVIPGRANLYLGALARLERSGHHTILKRQTDRLVDRVSGRLGDPGGRSNVAQLLKGNPVNAGRLRVQGPSRVINAPTFRVSSTPASRAAAHELQKPRAPRRRTRARSAHRVHVPSTVTEGIQTARPKALPKGARRTRKTTARGRRVRR